MRLRPSKVGATITESLFLSNLKDYLCQNCRSVVHTCVFKTQVNESASAMCPNHFFKTKLPEPIASCTQVETSHSLCARARALSLPPPLPPSLSLSSFLVRGPDSSYEMTKRQVETGAHTPLSSFSLPPPLLATFLFFSILFISLCLSLCLSFYVWITFQLRSCHRVQ